MNSTGRHHAARLRYIAAAVTACAGLADASAAPESTPISPFPPLRAGASFSAQHPMGDERGHR